VGCDHSHALVAEGCYVEDAQIADSVIGIRTSIGTGCRIARSVLLGADYYESPADKGEIPIGIGRDVVLDRVIVDKNARIGDRVSLTNTAGVQEANGSGYYIRSGIVIVPKDGVIEEGTVV
jgi:glucose-1-phosphate adenylyltransferase